MAAAPAAPAAVARPTEARKAVTPARGKPERLNKVVRVKLSAKWQTITAKPAARRVFAPVSRAERVRAALLDRLVAGVAHREILGRVAHRKRGDMKEGLVRYQVSKTNGGASYHEWPAAEIV
jgi:hypothetical protein